MSVFAFNKTDPRREGRVTGIDMSMADWFGVTYQEGINDVWTAPTRTWQHRRERRALGSMSAVISPELANELYGIPEGPKPLVFKEDIRSYEAELLHQERRQELLRLSKIMGATHRLASLKTAGGFAASMAASVSHPTDFAMMFFPVVGQARAAKSIITAGKAAKWAWYAKAAPYLARVAEGVITEEKLARVMTRFPRTTASIIDASIGEAVFQIPNFINESLESGIYDAMKEYGMSVGFAGATGAALRGPFETMATGLGAARHIYSRFGKGSRDAVAKKAFNDLMHGDPIRVKEIAGLDDNYLLELAKFDADAAKAKASQIAEGEFRGRETELEEKAKARLEREGIFGKINRDNLLHVVRRILDNPSPNVRETPERMLLAKLLKRYESMSERPWLARTEVPALQRRELAKAMANVLRMHLDDAAEGIPPYYMGDAVVFSPSRVPDFTEQKASKEAEEIAYLEFLRRETDRLRRIMDQRMRRRNPDLGRIRSAQKRLQEVEGKLNTFREGLLSEEGRYTPPVSNDEMAEISMAMWRRDQPRIMEWVAQEKARRAKEIFDELRKKAMDDGRAKAIADQQKLGRMASDELLKSRIFTELPSDENLKIIDNDIQALMDDTGLTEDLARNLYEGKRVPEAEAAHNEKLIQKGLQPIEFDMLHKAWNEERYVSRASEVDSAYNCLKRSNAA